MNTEQEQQDEAARRKFDDIASLYQPIVPPPGTPVRPDMPAPPVPAPPLAAAPSSAPATPAALVPVKSAPVQLRPDAKPAPAPAAAAAAPLRTEAAPPPAAAARSRSGSRRVDKAKKAPAAAQMPWPDAFKPRPNWRPSQAVRSWSWLLLVPLGIIAAVVVATLDTRAVRDFVDRRVLHRVPQQESDTNPLLPAPFRTGPATPPASPVATPTPTPTPAPTDAPAAGPSGALPLPPAAPSAPSAPEAPAPSGSQPQQSALPPPEPAATGPAVALPETAAPAAADSAPPTAAVPASAPPSAAPLPEPAVPVPPPAVPAAAEPKAAEAPAATQAATPPEAPAPSALPSIARVTISYRRNQPDAEAEARRIAARLGGKAGAVELRATGRTYRSPTIHYYDPADKEAALALARTLAGDGGVGWVVRPGPSRAAGSVDIWVP